MARKPQTVMEVAIARAGVLKGTRVCVFIAQWTMAAQAIGRPITLEEYGEWWRESERTVYRHQADFRAVFGLPTPQPIADLAVVRAAAFSRGVAGVGAVPASLLPA